MFASPHRTKGGGPLLGAKGPHQRGPFGEWPVEDDLDDGLGDEQRGQDHDESACFR